MEKISQSKDDDEGAEDDESLEDSEDMEDEFDDDEDGDDDDAMASPNESEGKSQEGSDDDLLENAKRKNRQGGADRRSNGGSNRNSHSMGGNIDWSVN